MKSIPYLCFAILCSACSPSVEATSETDVDSAEQALSNKDFDVEFSDCSEFAGIGFVPASNARPLVPSGYTLAGDSTTALVVVRVARCAQAVVDGKAVGATLTSQVGITLQGPDPSADINNYTVFFATNQPRLHARFQAAGVRVDNSHQLALSLAGSALSAASASAHSSSFTVNGTVEGPPDASTSFAASWWADGVHGTVQARTSFPDIRFAIEGTTTTLTTAAGSALAQLLGGSTFTFPALDSYNTFPSAHLEVRRAD